jgi:hypothetical protein
MRPSNERTDRMEQIFEKMRALATASYPLLDELAKSPSPGDRLAAVAILEVFATKKFFPFATRLPFIHAFQGAFYFAFCPSCEMIYWPIRGFAPRAPKGDELLAQAVIRISW